MTNPPATTPAPSPARADADGATPQPTNYFAECVGATYEPVAGFGYHQATHPQVVREALAAAKDRCPIAADVIASLVFDVELRRQRVSFVTEHDNATIDQLRRDLADAKAERDAATARVGDLAERIDKLKPTGGDTYAYRAGFEECQLECLKLARSSPASERRPADRHGGQDDAEQWAHEVASDLYDQKLITRFEAVRARLKRHASVVAAQQPPQGGPAGDSSTRCQRHNGYGSEATCPVCNPPQGGPAGEWAYRDDSAAGEPNPMVGVVYEVYRPGAPEGTAKLRLCKRRHGGFGWIWHWQDERGAWDRRETFYRRWVAPSPGKPAGPAGDAAAGEGERPRVPPLDSVPPEERVAVSALANVTHEEAHRQGEWASTFGLTLASNPYPKTYECVGPFDWWADGWHANEAEDPSSDGRE